MTTDKTYVDGLDSTFDWQRLPAPIAVLPVGACEQHGPHLPLLTDTLKVEYFARHVAQSLGAALLPTLAITQSYEHSGFRGSLSLKPATFMQVIRDIAEELEGQHFTRLIIVNGHGGNYALGPVIRELNHQDRPIRVLLANYWEYDQSGPGLAMKGDGIHSGAWETSLMLALFPDLVHGHEQVEPGSFPGNAQQSDLNHWGMAILRPNGVWGDPRKASAEAGRAIAASIQENIVSAIRERLDWFDQHASYAGQGPVVVRPMTEPDLPNAEALSRAAGWDQRPEDWHFLYSLNPKGCFVALHNGRLIGTVTTANYEDKAGWIAMLLVDPAFRRRGLGRQLLSAAMDALAPCPAIKLDATPAGKPLYDQTGYAEEYAITRMIAPNLTPQALPPHTTVRKLDERGLEAITAFDEAIFGVNRHAVLAGFLAMAPETAFLLERDGEVAGFCLGRPGRAYHHIGPLIAPDLDAARALASAAFEIHQGQPVVIDIPTHTPAWSAWLETHGFAAQRPLTRMYYGANPYPGIPTRTFAIAGPELG